MENTFTLTVTGSGPFNYEIINDQTGEVVIKTKSKRQYVAATIDGFFWFGRLDLIGKGTHAKAIKIDGYSEPIATIKATPVSPVVVDEPKSEMKNK